MIALHRLPDAVPVEIADSIEANLNARRAGAVRRPASPLRAVSTTAIACLAGAVCLSFFTLATSATAGKLALKLQTAAGLGVLFPQLDGATRRHRKEHVRLRRS
jgi:hypothetical protein